MNLTTRLAKLESITFSAHHSVVQQFAIEGPADLPDEAASAFLKECGHEVRDKDFVLVFIGVDQDLPLKDVTASCRG